MPVPAGQAAQDTQQRRQDHDDPHAAGPGPPDVRERTILGGSLAEPATYLHKVCALIEAPAFHPHLSGRENLKVLARLGRLPLGAIEPVLERSGLPARAGDRYPSYSLRMKKRFGTG